MTNITHKDLFTLVREEIVNTIQFQNPDVGSDQLSRINVQPFAISGANTDVTSLELVRAVQGILNEALPNRIIEGLAVNAYDPSIDQVQITAGKGAVGGTVYTLAEDIDVRIPFDSFNDIFYINLKNNTIFVDTAQFDDKLTLAKIIVPNPGTTDRVTDKDPGDGTAYIIQMRKIDLHGNEAGELEEDSLELFRDNIGDILADNIIGNLRLSENLKITNVSGTMQLDSTSMKLLDTDGDLLAKFDRNGTFFYDENEIEIAKFAVDGAKIGNINIFPNSIQSNNFVSGALGAGFQIRDDGNAEFNNICARGKISTTVFEKESISVIGGNLLVLDGDVLENDMSTLDTSLMTIKGDTTFSVGDILRIKDGTEDEWFSVTDATDAPTYSVWRDRAGQYASSSNPAWKAGTAVVKYGQPLDGGIFMTSSESNSPYISVFDHEGSPWSATCTRLRIGQLNGFLDYVSDAFGIAIGDTNDYMTYDKDQGLRIKGNITITGGDVPPKTFYQTTAPSNPADNINEGDYWVDTDDNNNLYIYQSSTWVEIAADTSSGGLCVFCQAGIPTSVNTGDLWVDSDDNDRLYRADSVGADQITSGEWELIATACSDSSGNLISSVLPGTNIGTPAGAGLFLGADYLGYYSGSSWDVFIDNSGNFSFCGDSGNFVAWDGSQMCVRGVLNADDLVAGTILGRTIKTAETGSRIEMDNTCFSAFDDSSGLGTEVFKISISGPDVGSVYFGDVNSNNYANWDNQTGQFCIRSESIQQSAEAVCSISIGGGNITANDMCLVDPLCDCCYSFLSAGNWFFHDTRGDCIPYIRRICSGTACTGDYVCLIGWTQSPSVMVGIKQLNSYDGGQSAQDQQWDIYNDTPIAYDNGGIDFGYCFQVHAQLQLATATGSEVVKSAAFNTCSTTCTGVCATCVRAQFQLWCNAATANYFYGTICYAVCYRCNGCGVWCATCFSYTQPHASVGQMQITNDHCNSITFPCSAQWEIMLDQVSLSWTDSGFDSETVTCHLCCRAINACVVNKTQTWSCSCVGSCGTWKCCCWQGDTVTVAGSAPSNIFCTYVCYQLDDHANCLYNCLYHQASSGCGCSCVRVEFKNGAGASLYVNGHSFFAAQCGTHVTCGPTCTNWSKALTCVDMTACSASAYNSFKVCSCFRMCFHQCNLGNMCFARTLCSQVDVCSTGCVFHCYCQVSGSANDCQFKCLHSLTDTFGAQTTLDPTGCLNWIAMSAG